MKNKKERSKKKIIILAIIFIILTFGLVIYQFFSSKEESSSLSGVGQPIKIVPLSEEEKQIITQTVVESEFIEDIPEEYPIALRFFSFEDGEKIWHDGFLIGHNQLLTNGEPEIYLSLHSKYIAKLDGNDICNVIKEANENGDLGFESDSSKTNLLWKYKGMIKHRDCFGF